MKSIFDFTLRKTGPTQWTIVSSKGHDMHTITRCFSEREATNRAKAWISSWHGSTLEVEEQDEQDKKTD